MSEYEDTLDALREALTVSPDNVPLRRQLGKMLVSRGQFDEAAGVYRDGLQRTPESEALKLGLADCFYRKGKFSEALVLVEDLARRPDAAGSAHLLHARLLLRQGHLDQAARAYRQGIDADPALADDELAEALDVDLDIDEDDEDDEDFAIDAEGRIRLRDGSDSIPPVEMEKPKFGFDAVGGMDDLKEQIRLKIIEPLNHPEIYAAYGKAIGGGILLYGPPGCGKTHLARATAGEVKASFINVGIHDVLDMYLGGSEQKLHALFQYARSHTPCVLFFDEVDALGASRSDLRESWSRRIINQFLAELDGVDSQNEGVLVLAATNAPWNLDGALRRPGRFDRILFVPPPDDPARSAILEVMLRNKPVEAIDYEAVAKKAQGFSGADLKALIDQAVEAKLRDAMKRGAPTPLTTKDLIKAAKAVKPSTKDWFATARNYALYANEAGLYDDILDHLKLR